MIDVEKLAREAGVTRCVGRKPHWLACTDELERFAALVLEQAAQKCDDESEMMEKAAERAIENGEIDEVSSIRSAAWKLCVAGSKIRAMKPEAK